MYSDNRKRERSRRLANDDHTEADQCAAGHGHGSDAGRKFGGHQTGGNGCGRTPKVYGKI